MSEGSGGGGGEQFSRGSSLSLFSGFGGTSSVSGAGSDPGGVGLGGGIINVDELTDDQLETAVEELKTALRLLILETLMFESYYERLASGQVQVQAGGDAAESNSCGPGIILIVTT